MKRFLLVDSAGLVKYQFIVDTTAEKERHHELDTQLLGAFLSAISSFANQVGGELKTISISIEKIAHRRLYLEDQEILLIVLADNKTSDEILSLESELIIRVLLREYEEFKQKLLKQIEESGKDPVEQFRKISHVLLENFQLHLEAVNLRDELKLIRKSKVNLRKLIKQVRSLTHPYSREEKFLQLLAEEVPTSHLLLDPALLAIKKEIFIPANLKKEEVKNVLNRVISDVLPIIGKRSLHQLAEKVGLDEQMLQIGTPPGGETLRASTEGRIFEGQTNPT